MPPHFVHLKRGEFDQEIINKIGQIHQEYEKEEKWMALSRPPQDIWDNLHRSKQNLYTFLIHIEAFLGKFMKYEVILTEKAHKEACSHLLSYFRDNKSQEELCFALWYPSIGKNKTTALISEIILPQEQERKLHGNASFFPEFLARSLRIAIKKQAGLCLCTVILLKGGRG